MNGAGRPIAPIYQDGPYLGRKHIFKLEECLVSGLIAVRHPGKGRDSANASLDSRPNAIRDDRGEGIPNNFAGVGVSTRRYTGTG